MIGSGIFIVPADMARNIGSAGWLLVAWGIAAVLTVAAALSYGELASMLPRAGGMYVYLREAFSPLVGFLFGWTLFTVIQTGTIAAVAVAFARFTGVLWPSIAEDRYSSRPSTFRPGTRFRFRPANWRDSGDRSIDLDEQPWSALRQDRAEPIHHGESGRAGCAHFMRADFFAARRHCRQLHESLDGARCHTDRGIAERAHFGRFIRGDLRLAIRILFAADSWHDITFTSGEVRDPQRTVPRALAIGTICVLGSSARERCLSLVLPLQPSSTPRPIAWRQPCCK